MLGFYYINYRYLERVGSGYDSWLGLNWDRMNRLDQIRLSSFIGEFFGKVVSAAGRVGWHLLLPLIRLRKLQLS